MAQWDANPEIPNRCPGTQWALVQVCARAHKLCSHISTHVGLRLSNCDSLNEFGPFTALIHLRSFLFWGQLTAEWWHADRWLGSTSQIIIIPKKERNEGHGLHNPGTNFEHSNVIVVLRKPFFFAYLWDKIMRWTVKPAFTGCKLRKARRVQTGSVWAFTNFLMNWILTPASWLLVCFGGKITPVSTEQSLIVPTVTIFLRKRFQLYSFQPSFSPELRMMLLLFINDTSSIQKTTAKQS